MSKLAKLKEHWKTIIFEVIVFTNISFSFVKAILYCIEFFKPLVNFQRFKAIIYIVCFLSHYYSISILSKYFTYELIQKLSSIDIFAFLSLLFKIFQMLFMKTFTRNTFLSIKNSKLTLFLFSIYVILKNNQYSYEKLACGTYKRTEFVIQNMLKCFFWLNG